MLGARSGDVGGCVEGWLNSGVGESDDMLVF